MTTPKLGMAELTAGIGQPHLVLNAGLKTIDYMLQRNVDSVLTYADPDLALAEAGRVHIVGESPTGAWAGKYGQIASWLNTGGWEFIVPKLGMVMWDRTNVTLVVYVGDDSSFDAPWQALE